ncbi:MAG: hypothetical protein IJU26_05580, partial [Synergistaceae bacterium]|nr:hypothetical protein [Synergistaceae bacterium]
MRRYLYAVAVFIALLVMASSSWAGYYDEGHSGLSESDPFIIDSRNDFVEFRDRINAGSDPQGAYYKLNTTSKTISLAKDYQNWTPIGTSYRPFTGHLDGNGHKITVNFDYFTLKEAALFGTVKTESGCAVKNLTVATSSSGQVKGELVAGIVLNLYNASIEDCKFSGTLVASTSTGDYGANTVAVGGIVHHMYSGSVKNCTVENATLTISPRIYILSYNYAGGIAAIMESGTIEGCTVSEGTVFDGAEGLLVGNSAASVTTGGIVGQLVSGTVNNNEAYISVNYEDAKNLYLGGVIGEIKDEDYYIEGNIYSGTGFGIGSDIDGEPSDEPGCSKIGEGTEDQPIIIDSISAFTNFYEKVNADVLYAADMYYKLTIDLDISELNCKPIGTEANPFTGHFDGNGHTIITDNDAALFGTIKTASGYAVKNLNVIGNVKGRFSAGIVLNLYNASIENCTFTGKVRAYVGSDPDLDEMDT